MLAVIFAAGSAFATIDASLQMQLGNPSGAIADTNNHSHYLILRPIEAIDYNNSKGLPNWASWSLTAGDANNAVQRQDSFAANTNLPPNFHWVGPGDYAGSGYDRGHLCPSADRTDSTNHNDMTFLMDNMMPQASDNNSGVWNSFESYCRNYAVYTNYEVLVICGPGGFTGAKINTNGYVWIPSYTWKIAVFVPPGAGAATNRINANTRVIAIKVPNTNGVSSAWKNHVTSVNQIQVDTGFTFFTALPPELAAVLRAKVDGQTNPPPAIYSFSPSSGGTNAPVVITGTNFSGVTQVAFNGVSAVFVVDSSVQITAHVPSTAASGFISVTSPGGTAIGADSFAVTGRTLAASYFGVLAGWDVSGQSSFGPSPLAPTTNAPNLSVVGLARGSGVTTSGTGKGRAWGGTGFTNVTETGAISSNLFAVFSLAVSNGYKLSVTNFARFDYFRSGTGPTNGVLQFQVGDGAFINITNYIYSSSSSGAANAPIDLSGFPTLQNIGAGTNVTFRIVNYNGGSQGTGTWYVYDYANSSALDLAVTGIITPVADNGPPPSVPPGFQSFNVGPSGASLVITGAPAASYTILASTNLSTTNWTTLLTTNPASLPFTFTDTNQLPLRFYRVLNP